MADPEEHQVQFRLTLCLPSDESSVPVARHIVRSALDGMGVDRACVSDIEVALTEASTNVLKHSGPGDEYEVSCEMTDGLCTIRVVDTGRGFDHSTLGGAADTSAERGRGIQLMRALVDSVRFMSKPENGTIVHLEKSLEFSERSIVARASR
jgi:serine/threonine-protein kinase RsbW